MNNFKMLSFAQSTSNFFTKTINDLLLCKKTQMNHLDTQFNIFNKNYMIFGLIKTKYFSVVENEFFTINIITIVIFPTNCNIQPTTIILSIFKQYKLYSYKQSWQINIIFICPKRFITSFYCDKEKDSNVFNCYQQVLCLLIILHTTKSIDFIFDIISSNFTFFIRSDGFNCTSIIIITIFIIYSICYQCFDINETSSENMAIAIQNGKRSMIDNICQFMTRKKNTNYKHTLNNDWYLLISFWIVDCDYIYQIKMD